MTQQGGHTKRCCRCKVAKPSTNDHFPKRNDRPSGLGYICKQCLRGVSNANRLSRQSQLLLTELTVTVEKHVRAVLASYGLASKEK